MTRSFLSRLIHFNPRVEVVEVEVHTIELTDGESDDESHSVRELLRPPGDPGFSDEELDAAAESLMSVAK